jgi:hypothetical protein
VVGLAEASPVSIRQGLPGGGVGVGGGGRGRGGGGRAGTDGACVCPDYPACYVPALTSTVSIWQGYSYSYSSWHGKAAKGFQVGRAECS